jgi:hypothetical protein
MSETRHTPRFEIQQTEFAGINSYGQYVMRVDCPAMNSPHDFANQITVRFNSHEQLLAACKKAFEVLGNCEPDIGSGKAYADAELALHAAIKAAEVPEP